MNVLLTGGAGYIGSHTAVCLLEAGYSVCVVDDLSNASREALNRVEKLTGKTVPFYLGDCADKAFLRNVFEMEKPDAVVHFAGFKAVGESVQKPLDYYRNNIGTTIALCEVMGEYGCSRIVFSSSATVYGTNASMPLRENSETGCTNPYGWTKWMNEQILRDYEKAGKGLSIVILRYFNPVGAHPSGMIGEDPSGIPNNLMPFICQVASGKLECLRVFGNDYPTKDGTGVRDYIHVCDLAAGHLDAIKYAEKNTGVLTVNLGTGEGYSVLDMIHAFEKVNDLKIPYVITERRPGDISECYADAKLAYEKLGWKAERKLEDMCRDAWNWQRNNPSGYNK